MLEFVHPPCIRYKFSRSAKKAYYSLEIIVTKLRNYDGAPGCSVEAALHIMGGKWKARDPLPFAAGWYAPLQ